MAKVKKRFDKRTKTKLEYLKLDLKPINFYILSLGLLLIIIGYVFLAQKSVDGFLPTVIAPIFLVLGYCVVIPIGLLFKYKTKDDIDKSFVNTPDIDDTKKSNIKVT